ncbi:MAG: TetR/AcrR family transcriptional regulator [Myxococcaceae bacterium]
MRAEQELSPRKSPRQERARATVDAIVAATARILVKHGYDALSTNRVAEEAGVSIGSLYQYFPSKESLVAAVGQRHFDKMMQAFEGAFEQLADAPLPVVARTLIRLLIEAHSVEPKLHRVLMEQIPLGGRPKPMQEFDKNICTMVRAYLEVHAGEVRPRDLDMATFVLMRSMEALCHGAVLERPEYLKGERFIDEATELVVRYLDPGHGSPKKARA